MTGPGWSLGGMTTPSVPHRVTLQSTLLALWSGAHAVTMSPEDINPVAILDMGITRPCCRGLDTHADSNGSGTWGSDLRAPSAHRIHPRMKRGFLSGIAGLDLRFHGR